MPLVIGIDGGTTSLKAGLFDEAGRLLAAAGEEYGLSTPAPDRAELEAGRYWDACQAVVRHVLRDSGVRPADVGAIAVSSQGETLVPVAADGRPLSPAIVWLDNRAAAEALELEARFGDAAVYAATGIPAVVPTWPACKILWWRRHEPGVFAGAAKFLLVEDLLLHRLTGRFVSEGGVQCTSMLYDIRSHGWWDAMLECLELPPARLPELAGPGEVVGTLAPSAAAALGLGTGVRVVAGGMDQGAGAVGVGNIVPGIVSESTGGALTLQATIGRPDGDATGQTPVYVHSAAGMYLYCPVCPTGGMALTWFRDTFGAGEVERAAATGRSPYDLLTELAAAAPPGCDGLTMLPHLMGAFSPEYVPAARGAFAGFTLGHGRAHFARAVLESVAFMLRRNLELLASAGAPATEIHSHGGGARSDLWCRIKADACGLPVVRLEGSEAAVRGDAMLAAVAIGGFRDLEEAVRAMVMRTDRFEPDEAVRPAYDEAYRRYVELFDALRPTFVPGSGPGGAAAS